MAILYILGFIVVLWVGAAIAGFGKNEVFKHPERMTDAQLDRTIRLCAQIENNSPIMSKAHQDAAKKSLAAMNELSRRYGVPIAPR